MKMETVSKPKYILLDDESASLPYAGLLIELVVDPIMKWLKEMWSCPFFTLLKRRFEIAYKT